MISAGGAGCRKKENKSAFYDAFFRNFSKFHQQIELIFPKILFIKF
jgi:hypothetical protein